MFFVYKGKLSLALLKLADMFTNKIKTRLIVFFFFYRMVLDTKRIHNSFWRNFSGRTNQKMPLKFLFVGKKTRPPPVRSLRAKIIIVGNSKWVKNHHFCAQLSHCFIYTKTIIPLNVGGEWWIFTSVNLPLATSTLVNNCYLLFCRFRGHTTNVFFNNSAKRKVSQGCMVTTWVSRQLTECCPKRNVRFFSILKNGHLTSAYFLTSGNSTLYSCTVH